MKDYKKRSFTLIEVMVVVAIFSLVFGIILYFLVVGEENLSIVNTKVTLQQDLRRTLRIMTEELSQASSCGLENGNKKIECTIPTNWSSGEPSDEITVSYELNSNNIIRNGDVVVSGINLISASSGFKSITSDEFQIFITAERKSSRQRDIRIEIGSNVHLRN
jgi:prepilin-type N-terminal cleavage/methylation domain-containing protein